jgi:hypothetical protein
MKMAIKKEICIPTMVMAMVISGVSSLGAPPFAFADNAAAPPAATAGNTDAAAAQVTALKQEQTQLRRMSEAVKRVRRANLDLIGECTQPMEMAGEIDIIGMDVIPIMPATAEGFGQNYLPPRPKYINLHMTQLGALIPILKDDIDMLAVPDAEKDFASGPLQDLGGYMGDIKQHYKNLKSLTKSSDYDVISLTNEARGIDDCCKNIESARKKLLHEGDKVERQEEKVERQQEKLERSQDKK